METERRECTPSVPFLFLFHYARFLPCLRACRPPRRREMIQRPREIDGFVYVLKKTLSHYSFLRAANVFQFIIVRLPDKRNDDRFASRADLFALSTAQGKQSSANLSRIFLILRFSCSLQRPSRSICTSSSWSPSCSSITIQLSASSAAKRYLLKSKLIACAFSLSRRAQE